MANDNIHFTGFAALASPHEVASAAVELYGVHAATAAAWCALTARFDGRDADYCFWFAVFSQLRASAAAAVDRRPETVSQHVS